MNRSFPRGRGGGAPIPRGPAQNRFSSSWDSSGWGIDSSQQPREQDSGWGRRRRDRGASGSSSRDDEAGWGLAPQVGTKATSEDAGWGTGKMDAPGWGHSAQDPGRGGDAWGAPVPSPAVEKQRAQDNPRDTVGWGTSIPSVEKSRTRDHQGRDTGSSMVEKRRADESGISSSRAGPSTTPTPLRQPRPFTQAASHRDEVPASPQSEAEQIVDLGQRPRPSTGTGTDNSSITLQPVSRINPSPTLLFFNKKDKWGQMIALFSRAVTLELEIQKQTDERDRFKRAQLSKVHGRIGPAGRSKLDGIRVELEESLGDKKKEYSDTIKALTSFDEGTRLAFVLDPKKIEEEANNYVTEAKSWMITIRPLLIQHFSDVAMSTEPIADEDVDMDDTTPTGSKRRKSSASIKDLDPPRSLIMSRITHLQDFVEKLQERLADQDFASLHDMMDKRIDAKIAALGRSINGRQAKRATSWEDGECTPDPTPAPIAASTVQIASLARRSETLRADLTEVGATTAEVHARTHEIEEELKKVRAMNEELKQERGTILDQLAEMTKFREEQEQQNAELASMLQKAIANRPTPASALPPPQIWHNETREEISNYVRSVIEDEINPAVTSVRENCSENVRKHTEAIYQEFWARVSRPLKMAEAISLILDSRPAN